MRVGTPSLRTAGAGLVALALVCLAARADAEGRSGKVGVLLVSHGSRSAAWRAALLQVARSTREPLLRSGRVDGVKTAFMEYTEPSLATSMREFDAEGFSDVVVLPVFLTVSSHTFDDVPTILGLKADPQSLELLKVEGIARYSPRARVHMGPRLDFSALVQENVLRRARRLSRDPGREGLVLIAYGDVTYGEQWSALLEQTAAHVMKETGIGVHAHAWAGHVVRYDPAHTTQAIEQVLRQRARALVIPVFVAFDEMFQVGVIGKGIARVPGHEERVAYTPDAILPDPGIDAWIVQAALGIAAGAGAQGGIAAR